MTILFRLTLLLYSVFRKKLIKILKKGNINVRHVWVEIYQYYVDEMEICQNVPFAKNAILFLTNLGTSRQFV